MNNTTDSQLLINAIRQKYPDNTGQYLFKSCQIYWIVVLKKTNRTITTQSRLPLDDPNRQFAKYRANKLMVVDIINKFNPNETTDEISNSYYMNHTTKYIKGNIVIPDSFHRHTDEVCSSGIHFYETIDCAFYLELIKVENGKWTEWYENGQKKEEAEYLNGKQNGKWTGWYENGQIGYEGEYLNGKINGKWTFWYEDGWIESEGEFLNGKRNNKWTYWYKEYLNRIKYVFWNFWYHNGQIKK